MDWRAACESFEDFHDERTVGARLHAAGLTTVVVPPEGGRVDPFALCAAREALAYRSGMADSVLAVIGLGSHPLGAAGGPEARRRWLDPVAAGKAVCGFALTEPEAGSDVASIATTARLDPNGGGQWVLDGKKTFISNATIADWFVLFARAPGGPAAFVVERNDPGVAIVHDVPMSSPHPIGSIELLSARIPADRLIGKEGDGIRLALGTLDVFRVSVAGAACGMAARALDDAITRVKARKQFGKALAEFQLTQGRIADCAVELAASRGLVRRACEALAAGDRDAKLHVAMAKLYATEAAQRIIDAAVQLHGGLGVVRGVKVEELYREIRPLRIYEGTSEIQKLIISRELLKDPR
jgi:alkylation response protein AidB-like acyl-CoA dehydrogenase